MDYDVSSNPLMFIGRLTKTSWYCFLQRHNHDRGLPTWTSLVSRQIGQRKRTMIRHSLLLPLLLYLLSFVSLLCVLSFKTFLFPTVIFVIFMQQLKMQPCIHILCRIIRYSTSTSHKLHLHFKM